MQQGSTGSLGAVEVAVTDAWGNPAAPGKDFEVTLRPAAIATDGSGTSAKVTARGSNRAKLRGGSATFLDVQLKADADGEFALAAYCKSRTLVRVPPRLHPLRHVTARPPCSTVSAGACGVRSACKAVASSAAAGADAVARAGARGGHRRGAPAAE